MSVSKAFDNRNRTILTGVEYRHGEAGASHDAIDPASEAEIAETGAGAIDAAAPSCGTRTRGMGRPLAPGRLEILRKTRLVRLNPDCGRQDLWWFPCADQVASPESN